MKEIIFVRHAKSDWGNEQLKDIDRHLSERGSSDAYLLSEWYAKNQAAPDLVVSSPAVRALSTALIFMRAMDLELSRLLLEKNIYEAKVSQLLNVIRKQDNTRDRLMIFGHNPGFTDACNELSKDLFFDNVPTCGIVSFSFNMDSWKELEAKSGKLNYHHFPKDYKNND